MKRGSILCLIVGLAAALFTPGFGQEDYLKIDCLVSPRRIPQGQEGVLKIRITTRSGIRISSYPEFMIRLNDTPSLSFAKSFFLGSELNFPTTQENGNVFLDLQKDVELPFKVSENALTGTQTLTGEIVYTVFFQDSWHVKTFQKFSVPYSVRRHGKRQTSVSSRP
jgi:hypothetical protein